MVKNIDSQKELIFQPQIVSFSRRNLDVKVRRSTYTSAYGRRRNRNEMSGWKVNVELCLTTGRFAFPSKRRQQG